MAFAKFQENRFRIDGEIAENHAILVNLTASIRTLSCKNEKSPAQLARVLWVTQTAQTFLYAIV